MTLAPCDRRRLLLLDEPFGALDPQVRKSLRTGLKQIIDRVGITAIFVTHDQVRGTPREAAEEPNGVCWAVSFLARSP